MKLGFLLSAIVVGGALTASGALGEEAAPAAKASAPAVKETTTTSSSATHAAGHESPPARESASGPAGAIGGGAAAKGAAGNRGVQGKGQGISTGESEKAGKGSTSSAKESGTVANPIDTRITVQTPRAAKKPPLANEKKMSAPAAPPAANSARQTIPRDMNGSPRNAIGVPLDDHARTHAAISGLQGNPPVAAAAGKGAVGSLGAMGNASAAVVQRSASPMSAGSAPHNHAVITGTGFTRPGSGSGTLGGPAKNAAAINGTNIRPRH